MLHYPWEFDLAVAFPGEHRRGICAVECVTAHLRVFWIEEWSIEFGYHWLDVAHVHDHSPLSAPLRRY